MVNDPLGELPAKSADNFAPESRVRALEERVARLERTAHTLLRIVRLGADRAATAWGETASRYRQASVEIEGAASDLLRELHGEPKP